MMMEGLTLLLKLQHLDDSIQKLEETKVRLGHDRDYAETHAETARETLQTGTGHVQSIRMALDKRDGDLKEVEERVKKFSTQLNTIKTNKEYTAIQHEIMGAKADKSKIEDEILTMMDESESQQNRIRELTAKAKEADAELVKRRQAIAEAVQDADARLSRLKGERAELAGALPANCLQPYERLIKGARGQALSACRNFVCERCRMSLTANTVSLLMTANKLIFCQSCGRILYLPEDEDPRGGAGAGRK